MTTTTMTERLQVDEINREFHEVSTGKAILTAVASVFFAVGWLAGRVVPLLLWCCFAVRAGFRSAHGPSRKMRLVSLQAENAELKMQLSRFSG